MAKLHFDATEIKARVSLLEILEADGMQPRRSGSNHVVCCPFHDERTGSFTVFPDGGFTCFGCGVSGDVISYIQKSRGLSFPEAAQLLQDRAGIAPLASQITRTAKRQEAAPATRATYDRILGMAEALAGNPALCGRIADDRGWKPETIRNLALEAFLGWHDGKLAFLYEHRAKLRWKENGERRVIWEGKGELRLWRMFLLTLRSTRRVFITEGETDAIALLNAGAEKSGTVVVAMPSATTFKPQWAELFAGKEAIILADNDIAGQGACEKVRAALKPHARVATLDWSAI